jgi:hypothetical protein
LAGSEPGYREEMADETTEAPPELVREAQLGQSERTPAIALTAVFIVISAVVAVVVTIVLLVYFFV